MITISKTADKQKGVSYNRNNGGSAFRDNRPEAIAQRKLQAIANCKKGGTGCDAQKGPVQRAENRTGLPDNLKSGIENLSGIDMSDTRVHFNSKEPAALQAHAYARGNEIHIAAGKEKYLPHEAWHVVQQKQGRVRATLKVNGAPVNDDPGLEKEADVMGAKAIQRKAISSVGDKATSSPILPVVAQLNGDDKSSDSGSGPGSGGSGFNRSEFLRGLSHGPMNVFRSQIIGTLNLFRLFRGGDASEREQQVIRLSPIFNRLILTRGPSLFNHARQIYPQLPESAQNVIIAQGSYTMGSFIGSMISSAGIGFLLRRHPATLIGFTLFTSYTRFQVFYTHFTRSGRLALELAETCAQEAMKHLPKDRRDDDDDGGSGGAAGGGGFGGGGIVGTVQ